VATHRRIDFFALTVNGSVNHAGIGGILIGIAIRWTDRSISNWPKLRNFEVLDLASQKRTSDGLKSLDGTLIATDCSAFDWNEIARCSKLMMVF
jgi:hypothetical protein